MRLNLAYPELSGPVSGRSICLLLGILCATALTPRTYAAAHYIRAGATGANTGSTWTDAWTAFPSSWVRGDTYYVAGGTYNGDVSLSKTESGTLWITVKKANATDNGSDAGWNQVYATNQAVINGRFVITGTYIEIDGVTGTGEAGHGIKIQDLAMQGLGTVILFDGNGGPIHLYHLELRNGIPKAPIGYDVIIDNGALKKGLHIAYCWIHSCSKDGAAINNMQGTSWSDYGLLFENNVVSETGGALNGDHGQGIKIQESSSYLIFRNNIFRNTTGTAFIAFLGVSKVFTYAQFYNNVFYKDDIANFPTISPAVIYGRNTVTCTNFSIFNNTLWGLGDANNTSTYGQMALDGVVANNTLINNLWESCQFTSSVNRGFQLVSNNGYFNNIGGIPHEMKQVNGTTSTLVNPTARDFSLAPGGYAVGRGRNYPGTPALDAPPSRLTFTTDTRGLTRGGIWDIGAYQLQTTNPAPPANAQIDVRVAP